MPGATGVVKAMAVDHGPFNPWNSERAIQVYRVGGQHFVEDGCHRVSIAAATHQKTIDAYVTEIVTGAPTRR